MIKLFKPQALNMAYEQAQLQLQHIEAMIKRSLHSQSKPHYLEIPSFSGPMATQQLAPKSIMSTRPLGMVAYKLALAGPFRKSI